MSCQTCRTSSVKVRSIKVSSFRSITWFEVSSFEVRSLFAMQGPFGVSSHSKKMAIDLHLRFSSKWGKNWEKMYLIEFISHLLIIVWTLSYDSNKKITLWFYYNVHFFRTIWIPRPPLYGYKDGLGIRTTYSSSTVTETHTDTKTQLVRIPRPQCSVSCAHMCTFHFSELFHFHNHRNN